VAYGSADQTISREPVPPGTGSPDYAQASPTNPQPVLSDQQRYESPPPDFSSWYDPAPRSGAAPGYGPGSAYPVPQGYGPSAAQPAPGSAPWPDAQPPVRRQKSGLGWKIGVLLLLLIGAGAGAAAVVLLHHTPPATPAGNTSPGTGATSPGTVAGSPPQIITAINEQSTGALPAGYATYSQPAAANEKAGFSLAAPTTWKTSASGYSTFLTDPTTANVSLQVDLTPHTYPDMLKEAEFISGKANFPGYVNRGLARLTIRGQPGAYWKFTWDDKGVQQEAIDLLYVAQTSAGPQSYALYMTAPASIWDTAPVKSVFDEEMETFNPMP
jgi:hypothetical protein